MSDLCCNRLPLPFSSAFARIAGEPAARLEQLPARTAGADAQGPRPTVTVCPKRLPPAAEAQPRPERVRPLFAAAAVPHGPRLTERQDSGTEPKGTSHPKFQSVAR